MMIFIFGAIPFTDAMIVRYVDDRMRSRVAGMRLAVSLGISSLAVWLLGPLVKGMGFDKLLLAAGRRRAVHRVHGAMASRRTPCSRGGRGIAIGTPAADQGSATIRAQCANAASIRRVFASGVRKPDAPTASRWPASSARGPAAAARP